MPSPLDQLRLALRSTEPTDVLTASWEAFDLGQRAADAVVWEDGFDDLQALAAAHACTEARDLLPLPRDGQPIPLPEPPASALADCAAILLATGTALTALSARAGTDTSVLLDAAGLAEDAAHALVTLRTS
jgi:hypothetical protein